MGLFPSAAVAETPRRISILFLVDQLTELGGGERILLRIAQNLPADRFRVVIAAFRDNPDPSIWKLPCDIRIFPMTRSYGMDGLRVARKLHDLIRACEVDVVHTFFETSDLFGALVAKLSGVRAVISSRRDMGILRRAKHEVAYRLVSHFYNSVLTVSDQVRAETIRRDLLHPSKVVTIHNGIPFDQFARSTSFPSELRAKHSIPHGAPLVSTIANLQPWKGLDVFLRCAAEVHTRAPHVHFAAAGAFSDASLTASLFELTRDLGLQAHMHWIGPMQDVNELLGESDIFCLLSRSEGFPNVVLEAMAARLPVVATRVGGTPEAVTHAATGWLVDSGDSHTAAERVLGLLADDALRAAMGEAAIARVHAEFTSERMMDNYIRVYERVLNTTPPRGTSSR